MKPLLILLLSVAMRLQAQVLICTNAPDGVHIWSDDTNATLQISYDFVHWSTFQSMVTNNVNATYYHPPPSGQFVFIRAYAPGGLRLPNGQFDTKPFTPYHPPPQDTPQAVTISALLSPKDASTVKYMPMSKPAPMPQ